MAEGRASLINTLSGRFLLLTVAFVMLAEVLIFVPSVALFRQNYLAMKLERAQIASLAKLDNSDLAEDVERELLANAGVFNVVLRRNDIRELALSSDLPGPIAATYDLRENWPPRMIRDALAQIIDPEDRMIRVIGIPVQGAGSLIEVTMATAPLRAALIDYGLRILALSAVISGLTAALLFFAVRRLIVLPIRRVVTHMTSYAEAPEDARRIIAPTAAVVELREAEDALHKMQTQLTSALRQKDRLAMLGSAVAKISHDLRNMLTTAQLFADRMEGSADPVVTRAAPKLEASIRRAVSLCEATLTFGRAEEPPPQLARFALRPLAEEAVEGEGLEIAAVQGGGQVTCLIDIAPGLMIQADREQLYRVLANLVRNARQAIEATGTPGTIEIAGGEDEADWWVKIGDTGPGLPPKAREHLFTAFQGGARKGGSGLGLAISAELVRGHGGRLELLRSDGGGTEFLVRLPKSIGPA